MPTYNEVVFRRLCAKRRRVVWGCKPLGAPVCVFVLLTSLVAAQKGRLLELQGQVLLEPQVGLEGVKALVKLSSISEPYSARTSSDRKGRFKFPNLLPGTYSLSVLFPNRAGAEKTIEVTPSFASAGGIVTTTITLTRTGSPRSTSARETVSVRELSIPEDARKEFRRANKELEKRNLKGAIRHLEKAVALAPQFVEALNQLGTISYQTRDYARAEHYFRQALAQDPEAFAPLLNLGGALFSLKRYEEGLRINRQAVAARPDDALANVQLALCYFVLGKDDEARTYLLKAKTLDPGHFSFPQLQLADIYLREGSKQSALRELEDFLARHPDSSLADKVREKMLRLQSQE